MAKEPTKKEPPKTQMQKLAEPGGVTRRKVNRGSTRRIVRAFENVEKAMAEFTREMDIQVFVTDKDGERTGKAPITLMAEDMTSQLRAEVNKITSG